MLRKRWRKIHTPEGVYQYKVGKHSIYIISPSGVKTTTDQSQVTGLTWHDLEKGYFKEWFKGITPGHMKKYILKNLSPNV